MSAMLLSSCSNNITLDFFYDDELVEAPTRLISLKVYKGDVSCDDYMSAPHSSGDYSDSLITERQTSYPIIAETLEPEMFTEGQSYTLGAEAYDRDEISIARGCTEKIGGEFQQISLQLFGLAKCTRPPGEIDLALVVDTSSRSLARDPQLLHIKKFER